jgi:hypothetical protein
MLRHAAAVTAILVLSAPVVHAQDVFFTVTAASADVYQTPSTGGVVLGQAPRGTSFAVTRELGSWVRIPWPGAPADAGFLHVTRGSISRGGLPPASTRMSAAEPASLRGGIPLARSQPVARTQPPPSAVSLPSHVVGIGGRMGSDAFGFAASGRAWTARGLGLQIEVRRSTQAGLVPTERSSTMQFAPSAVYTPRDFVTEAVWVRPYFGGGLNLSRSTRDTLTLDEAGVDGGLGYQAFGGAEFTWANLPQLAVSADLRRLWMPEPFAELPRAGRFGASMSIHWYLR